MSPLAAAGPALRRALAAIAAAVALATPASAADPPPKPVPDTRPNLSPSASAPRASDPFLAIAIAEDERRWDDVLRDGLAHEDSLVRARAALAVGRLQDSTTVTALLPLLLDRAVTVRAEAAFALGQIGHRSARQPLEAMLAGHTPSVRALAVEALGKLMDRASGALFARLLRDPSPEMRGEAAIALWRLADSTYLGDLLERRADADAGVRWKVVYAMEKIVAPNRVVLPVVQMLEDRDPLVRAYAARTLGRQKSPRATAYLLETLNDPDVNVEINGIRALQMIADSTCASCLPELVEELADAEPYIRVTAATALADRFAWGRADSAARAAGLAALERALADPDAATRGAAARALLARRGADALDRVRPLLADSSLYTRIAVLQGLTQLPAGVAAPLLRERLSAGTPKFERMTAAEALGTLGVRDALPALRAGLDDPDALVAAAHAGALGELRDTSSVAALVRTWRARAGDADADARIAIRDALRQLAPAAWVDSLARAVPEPRPKVAYDVTWHLPIAARAATIRTTKGDIQIAFYNVEAPQTVKNFVALAARGYFDGTAYHRVVPNFVIQDGDPTGTGSGGPGYSIRCEYNRLRYDPGAVGMALSGKDTGGSQWFINHSPQPHLNGRYTIFARVIAGMDVVNRIVQGDRILGIVVAQP